MLRPVFFGPRPLRQEPAAEADVEAASVCLWEGTAGEGLQLLDADYLELGWLVTAAGTMMPSIASCAAVALFSCTGCRPVLLSAPPSQPARRRSVLLLPRLCEQWGLESKMGTWWWW